MQNVKCTGWRRDKAHGTKDKGRTQDTGHGTQDQKDDTLCKYHKDAAPLTDIVTDTKACILFHYCRSFMKEPHTHRLYKHFMLSQQKQS